MLVEFSVKNFMSIKNEITFSMVAGTGDENKDNIIENKKYKEGYLKSTAIYGANASGKSNFIKALGSAIMMVRKSNSRNLNELLVEMKPFKFDSKTVNEPCEFKFVFIKNDVKYIYGFSADINKVYTEYLYQYLSAKPSLIFEREDTNNYNFTQAEQSKLKEIALKNTENKLFLSTSAAWNYDKTKDAYMWFADNIDTFTDYASIAGVAFSMYEDDKNGELKKFTINLLNQADILIKDYDFEAKETEISDAIALRNMMAHNENLVYKNVKISTTHEIEAEKGNKTNYLLDFRDESLGTQNIFYFSPALKETIEEGKVMIIDEIDKSLHPLLVEFIIKLFHDKNINKNGAQLIFNTHDTNLLSLENFRRDQIWFTEKEPKSGATDLYPLDDFSVRKSENVRKGYLNGRYGAIPFLSTGDDLWKD